MAATPKACADCGRVGFTSWTRRGGVKRRVCSKCMPSRNRQSLPVPAALRRLVVA